MTLNDLISRPLQAEEQGIPVDWKEVARQIYAASCQIIDEMKEQQKEPENVVRDPAVIRKLMEDDDPE